MMMPFWMLTPRDPHPEPQEKERMILDQFNFCMILQQGTSTTLHGVQNVKSHDHGTWCSK